MQIVNVSPQMLFVQHRAQPSATDPDGLTAVPVGPGRALNLPDRADSLPRAVWLYLQPQGGAGARALFWKGAVPPGGVIDADPNARAVTWNRLTFDEGHLARAQAFVGDGSLDGITLEALRDHAQTRDPRGPAPDAVVETATSADARAGDVQFTPCQLAVAGVVLDAVLLVLGMGALIKEANAKVARDVANAAGPALLDAIQQHADALAAASPAGLEMATKVFTVFEQLGTALPDVAKAAISNLSLLDKALFAGLAAAQIAAIAASGGTWAIPFTLMQLGMGGVILFKDSVSCYQTCNPGQPAPTVKPPSPRGSYIVSQGAPLMPSSSPDNPRIVLWPHVSPTEYDAWAIEPSTVTADGRRVVKIRSLTYPDLYIVAPSAVGGNLTLGTIATAGGDAGGRVLWIATRFSQDAPPGSGDLPGYMLQLVSVGLGNVAMHVGNSGIATLQPFTAGEAPTDAGFFFQDLKVGDYDLADEIRIGWRLELFASNNNWSFWNGTEESRVPLPAQEGTLLRPEDASYWSVVAMAGSGTTDQGIAQVRVWSDATGRYIQAGFNARGSGGWFKYGKVDPQTSTASDESYGVVLSAWIIGTPGDDAGAGDVGHS